ncbi:hypothetical protein SAMN05216360_11815 [Methylobacterium phyllostachyos]|uniref:Uncharacterized protein n=1 Tax=Methylobacterium phyllostachyos TaxID=582672 RepID=A0A1H0I594_9HYPH|nr:hypothetical protein SAMN05216360_11815 [Methylobacterium phyllostachyos]
MQDQTRRDDNPLWYDYVLPDEKPARWLLALASLFSLLVAAARAFGWIYGLPANLRRMTARVSDMWRRSRAR